MSNVPWTSKAYLGLALCLIGLIISTPVLAHSHSCSNSLLLEESQIESGSDSVELRLEFETSGLISKCCPSEILSQPNLLGWLSPDRVVLQSCLSSANSQRGPPAR